MSKLTKRIKEDLGEIGARATPSPDAWRQIQERIERTGDNHQMEAVMIDTEEHPTSRGPRRLALAAAAAAVIVAVAAAVVAGDEGSDDQLGVVGEPEAPVDVPVAITVDGRRYVVTEPEVCFTDSAGTATDAPLLHVVGRTDDGSRVELGFSYDPDPIDPADTPGYTGRLSVQEGATASSWRPAVTTEPWPYLSIEPTGVTGEVTMADPTGEAVEVTLAVSCDS